jgi:hypothetical protein
VLTEADAGQRWKARVIVCANDQKDSVVQAGLGAQIVAHVVEIADADDVAWLDIGALRTSDFLISERHLLSVMTASKLGQFFEVARPGIRRDRLRQLRWLR